ncbi:chemotaxis protein CheW [Vibrio tapetis]|uniref:Putative Methyl-accepting chemotaxis protein n=1 Tax=Vibrio tapetis subsp. tapetis TaxID=1671868 RepID=A0A2N8ZE45_9VIBR|nr:chemotaxis protein CheW [Vibrio tapetis]SON50177.1 putative Methyl-accepting chemotaxis protein [Vibrio tapetis subsp. tapetis]
MIKEPEAVLSSEQALDDYFTALLGEDTFFADEASELEVSEQDYSAEEVIVVKKVVKSTEVDDVSISAEREIASQDDTQQRVSDEFELEPQAKLQSESSSSYTEVGYNEFELPDLDDVQRLLSQLESTNAADEPEIDDLINQNNVDIAVVTEVAQEEPALLSAEIQEWESSYAETLVDSPEVKLETITEPEQAIAEVIEPVAIPETHTEDVIEQQAETEAQTESGAGFTKEWTTVARNDAFQVLYFEVNSVVFAVPLDELGGIHQKAEELNHLIGRPDWYLGLQTNKNDQLDVVDTARWAMSEKLIDDTHRDSYQYIVMLDESHWGLASNQLMGTEWLSPEKIRWRKSAGKRPWLAGMVKEKMCALIHVDAMITMLDAGLDVKALDS